MKDSLMVKNNLIHFCLAIVIVTSVLIMNTTNARYRTDTNLSATTNFLTEETTENTLNTQSLMMSPKMNSTENTIDTLTVESQQTIVKKANDNIIENTLIPNENVIENSIVNSTTNLENNTITENVIGVENINSNTNIILNEDNNKKEENIIEANSINTSENILLTSSNTIEENQINNSTVSITDSKKGIVIEKQEEDISKETNDNSIAMKEDSL